MAVSIRRTSFTLALLLFVLVAPPHLAAQSFSGPDASIEVPIRGSGADGSTFAGTLSLQQFRRVEGTVNAIGTITGVLTSPTGVSRTIITRAALPLDLSASGAAAPTGTVVVLQEGCPILHLELGPLDLDLLGLVVHLDRVVLDITAQPGGGALLGNLLCALVGLLDGPILVLEQIETLLNQLLNLLG